jgi:hypothetical protein
MDTKIVGAVLASVLCVAGCASNESQRRVGSNDFAGAESSIQRANDSGAQRYASRELNMARDQLSQARLAAERGDTALAGRLAARAEVDAELAAATADNEEMQGAVEQLRVGLQTLREEIERNE